MKVIIDGLAVEYKDSGQGPTWLFLHGWMDNLQTFDPLIKALDGIRAVRLDLPGFGESEAPSEPWDVGRYAEFAQAFCQKLKIEPLVLVGHSFGGRIIIKALAEKILSPERVILIASAGVTSSQSARKPFYWLAAKVGKSITAFPVLKPVRGRLRQRLYRSAGSDYLDSGQMTATFRRVVAEDLSEVAKRIICPALLIWGISDTETPLKDGQKLASLIPNSKLEVLPEAGHFVHQEEPTLAASLIKQFTKS